MLLAVAVVLAASEPRVWLEAGLGPAGAPAEEFGGGVSFNGAVAVVLGAHPERAVGLVARGRETTMTADLRQIGSISFLLRYPSDTGPYVHLGFAHNHESPMADFLARPGASFAAVDRAITHRTGFEVGFGYDWAPPFPKHPMTEHLRPRMDVGIVVLPDRGGPPVYVVIEGGLRFGLDRLFG